MQTQMIKNTVNKLYKLPPVQLESAVRYIDELFKVSVEPTYFTDKKTNEPQDFMSSWQKRHEKYKQYLDNDSSWADVRDKNDFGREPIWGE
ncbi:MAG: hypothetical protein KGV51_07480 [Moraxellaceae bacterium]|nr:hypothetical protein [Moraxellaceae bacterium]